ncbi:MAG: SRPBCC family protein [Nocardioides sp.]
MTDQTRATDSVRIERTLEARAELVWQMWTEPRHFESWYGPAGATVTVVAMDVRVGGARHVGMKIDAPNGPRQMWYSGEHREVVRPRLLVYSESISDPDGNVLPADQAGLPAGYPTTTEITVEIDQHGNGTTMVLTHAGIPDGSPGATGWQMAIDKLASHLETRHRD